MPGSPLAAGGSCAPGSSAATSMSGRRSAIPWSPILEGTTPNGVIVSGAVFLGIASRIGPVYLAYGHSDHGVSALYLYLGSSLDFVRR